MLKENLHIRNKCVIFAHTKYRLCSDVLEELGRFEIQIMVKDKVQYIVALIAEFAQRYGLTDAQAARYMSRYGALELCDTHYGVMHTLTWSDNVENIAAFCRRKGGEL